MAISEILKIKTPSNIHKQAQKLSKREEMKKWKMKKIEDMVWFRISFDPTAWISSKQQ